MAVPLFNLTPDLIVSRLCLGTMTFGEQNSLAQSFQLLDKAFHSGINFFDSAEMYPVPQRAETQGRSEEYLGRWIRTRKIPRDQVVLATKVSGPSGQMTWIRGGPGSLDAWNITEAIDGSLTGLLTDCIDLYQMLVYRFLAPKMQRKFKNFLGRRVFIKTFIGCLVLYICVLNAGLQLLRCLGGYSSSCKSLRTDLLVKSGPRSENEFLVWIALVISNNFALRLNTPNFQNPKRRRDERTHKS